MKNHGLTLIALAIFLWALDRSTHLLSRTLGKLFCGDRWMQPVNGVVGDGSCGFNADIYLVVPLFALLLVGLVLYFGGRRRELAEMAKKGEAKW